MSDDNPTDQTPAPTPAPARYSLLDEFPPVVWAGLGVLGIGLLLLLIRLAAPVITPILLAFFLTALAYPGYGRLKRRGVRGGLALLIMLAIIVIGGVALLWLGFTAVRSLQEGLQTYSDQLAARGAELESSAQSSLLVEIGRALQSGGAGGVLRQIVANLAGLLADFGFAVVLVAFMLLESDRFVGLLTGALANVPVIGATPVVAGTAVSYFLIRARLNLITGAGVTILLLILGVDYALLWGVLTFFLSFVPYIGLAVAMIPPFLLGLAESGWVTALIIVLAIIVFNMVIENVLEPSYTGRKLSLSPTVVFVSFFFWAFILGPIGALLSMPITVLIMTVMNQHEQTRWIAQLIGREEAPQPD